MLAPSNHPPFNKRISLYCTYAGYVIILVGTPVWLFLLDLINPPSPSLPAEDLLRRVQDNQLPLLLGCSIVLFIWCLFIFWMAPITEYIRRMERAPILTFATLIACGGCVASIFLTPLFISLAGFRAEDALVVQTYWDIAMYMFIFTFPPFTFCQFILGIAVFADVNEEPLFPRWFAYFCIFCGMGTMPAYLLPFFHEGPFAYNGIIVWWFELIVYFSWFLTTTWMVHQRLKMDIAEQEEAISASAM